MDRIGLRHVTEGKLRSMQADYLQQSHADVTNDTWMRGHIDQLLTLSHTQWFVDFSQSIIAPREPKHLRLRRYTEKEIEELQRTWKRIDRCLLEFRPEESFGMDAAKQQYWLIAAVAARSSAAGTTTNEIFTPPRHLLTLSHRSLAASSTAANASAAANACPPNEVNQRNLGLGLTILASSLHLDVVPSGITSYMYYIATQQIIDKTAASSIF